MNEAFVGRSAAYYADMLRQHGPTHRGVDWNSTESQETRFRQLLRIADGDSRVEINDYGCGYGALVDVLATGVRPFEYCGYDASVEMVDAARARYAGVAGCSFSSVRSDVVPRAYTVASGVFNVKFDADGDEWWDYVAGVLDDMAAVSIRGFAFNLLTSYSDAARQRDNLFYAQPEAVFSHCVKRFSRFVAISHDYPLYEFTALVRL